MNLPNCVALFLVVTALTTFLLGIFFPLSLPMRSPLEVMEKTLPIIGDELIDNQVLSLVKHFPWLLPGFLCLVSTFLALALALAGFSIWHFVGRPRIIRIKHDASLEKRGEGILQRLIGEHAGALLGSDGQQHQSNVSEMASALQGLDPNRRHRFDLFIDLIRPKHRGQGADPLAPNHGPPSFHKRKTLARALAIVLASIGLLMILWMMLPLLFIDLLVPFYKNAIGVEFGPNDVILTVIFVWILALNPLGLAVGLIRLSNMEHKLQKAWDQGHDEAQEVLLASYRRQVKVIASHASTDTRDALSILHSLTYVSLPELDASGKGTVLKLLYGRGFVEKSGHSVDLRSMDFSGADLRELVLQNICLVGVDLRRAILADADFSEADLNGASLEGADLRNSNFQGACLRDADLRFARLHRANLQQADLSGVRLKGANLWQAKLRGVDLTHVQVDAAQLSAADC